MPIKDRSSHKPRREELDKPLCSNCKVNIVMGNGFYCGECYPINIGDYD